MSLVSIIGPRPNLFDLEGIVAAPSGWKCASRSSPTRTWKRSASISEVGDGHFKSRTLDITWPAEHGAAGMEAALDALCARAEAAVREGINIIILSDRAAGADRIPIPSLLACAAVHHHLIRQGLRTSVGLVVESGEPREVHHFACLAGYGAEAINPYLAFETLMAMKDELPQQARREGNRQALHQVDRQGPAQGDVQDGHLHLSVLLRRADLRRRRPASRISSPSISPAPRPASKASASTEIAEETRAAPPRRLQRRADLPRRARRRRRIRRSACAARTTSGRRRRSSALQHAVRGNSPDQYRAFAKVSQRAVRAAAHHPRPVPPQGGGGGRPQAGAARGGRAGQEHRASASPPARCRSARSRAKRTPRSPSP